jgi:predicted nucleotide-binding protein
MAFHVRIEEGWTKSTPVYDLSEPEMHERFLGPRERGEPVWIGGEGYDWSKAKLEIHEGPELAQLEDVEPAWGMEWLTVAQQTANVTDRFITGPPGAQVDAQPANPQLEPGEAKSVDAPVFLIHGHDELRKEQVARFLEKVGDAPVSILHEQSSGGRTLIEKLEHKAAPAQYAVALLTADDIGGPVGAEHESLRQRVRQNVILELGFFIGLIGRGRVAVLFQPGVELPSDLHGLAYIELDDGGQWKLDLVRELQSADIEADLARLN